MRRRDVNKIVAGLLVLTAIVMIFGIAMNISTMSIPPEETSGTSGKVQLYVTAEVGSPTTGEVSLVVGGG